MSVRSAGSFKLNDSQNQFNHQSTVIQKVFIFFNGLMYVKKTWFCLVLLGKSKLKTLHFMYF